MSKDNFNFDAISPILPSEDLGDDDTEEAENLAEKESQAYYSDRINQAKAAIEEEKAEILKQDRLERQKYAKYLFKLVCAWLLGVYSIIILGGLSASTIRIDVDDIPHLERIDGLPKFELSDTVLLALIGGTTVNVLGLFIIVANYLFPKPKDPE